MESAQAGLYEVKSIVSLESGNGVSAQVRMNADHDVFKGHFPEQPVLPGVCQLEMIADVLSKYLERPVVLISSSNIKFLHMIDPHILPEVTIDITIMSRNEDEVKIRSMIKAGDQVCLKCIGVYKLGA